MAVMPAHHAMPLVRASAELALDIDPFLPEALGMLGLVAGVYDYDWAEAENRFKLAMARERVPAQVRWWHSWFHLMPHGRAEYAVSEAQEALEEDPLNTMSRIMLADCLTAAHRHEEAGNELRRTLELDENSWFAYSLLAENNLVRGLLPEGLGIAERAYSLAPWSPNCRAIFAALLARNRHWNKADEILRELKDSSETYGVPRALLYFHALCGEFDQAAGWAEKAIEQRDVAVGLITRLLASTSSWSTLAKTLNLPSAFA